MALVTNPTYSVTISLVDRDRNKSSMSMHLPGSGTVADAINGVVTSVIPAIQGISNAVIQSWSISTNAKDDGAAALAGEDSDVERKGVFSFRNADGSIYTVSVPSIKNTLVVDRSNLINLVDPLVGAFVSAMTVGTTGAIFGSFLNSDIANLVDAVKVHRGSRRG